jgi:hypothetical protein
MDDLSLKELAGRREYGWNGGHGTNVARYPPGAVGPPMHDGPVTDERPEILTVPDRLVGAGLSQERIEQHLAAGRVRVDEELVTDLDRPAPPPARIVLWAE